MKTIKLAAGVFLILISVLKLEAQSGWVQTQLNSDIGYSLFVNDSIVYASTYTGVFATTSNGLPWFSKGPANHVVYDLIQTRHVLLAATVDGIFRSTNKGESWTLLTGSPKCSGVGGTQGHQVFAKNDSYVFMHSWANGLYRSGDEGLTWQQLTVGSRPGLSGDLGGWATCIFALGGKIFLCAPADRIGVYFSSNNGDTWNPGKSTDFSGADNLLFLSADHDTIYAGGFMGLYRSTDSGNNWNTQYTNTINPNGQMTGLGIFRDLVVSDRILIAAVDFKSLQRSKDGGKTWTGFNTGLISDWSFADLAIRPPYIWALTRGFGNAYRRSLTEIITEVKPEIEGQAIKLSLEQNSPNPATNSTTIAYSIKKEDVVTLCIFDELGNKIATILDKKQVPGYYRVEVSLQKMKSGTYFYRLKTGNLVCTRKMELIR